MNWFMDILRGIVIGVANIIPGVSGGTMAVSMGVYDKFIGAINNIFKKFKQSITDILPLGIGMLAGIFGFAFFITFCLDNHPLATNFAFIGLIVGGLPAIFKRMSVKKAGVPGLIFFVIFFALIVILPLLAPSQDRDLSMTIGNIIILFFVGALASATMVIPGVSGSMVLLILGYYNPVMTALKSIVGGNLSAIGFMIPVALGIVVGIFAVAKLLEVLLQKYTNQTYCAILGLVLASPVALLLQGNNPSLLASIDFGTAIVSALSLVVGIAIAYFLSKGEKQK